MMPWSGLSQTSVKHAYEMGTSELHRTSIMLAAIALTTNRSKYPKDLSQRLCEKAGRTRRPKSTALADHSVCAKSLDRSGPVTEVLTLGRLLVASKILPLIENWIYFPYSGLPLRTSPPVICLILASARASPSSVSLTGISLAPTKSTKSSPTEVLPSPTQPAAASSGRTQLSGEAACQTAPSASDKSEWRHH